MLSQDMDILPQSLETCQGELYQPLDFQFLEEYTLRVGKQLCPECGHIYLDCPYGYKHCFKIAEQEQLAKKVKAIYTRKGK